ncbi:MAG: helix-turn-helix domain-containing protein [Candidatus Kariarchaeaceae archaeon]
MSKEMISVLERVGLGAEEAKIYELLVSFSYRTLGQLDVYTKFERSQILDSLGKLIEKGYVKIIAGKTDETNQYLPLSPRIMLGADISAQINTALTGVAKEISSTWKAASDQVDTDLQTTQKEISESIQGFISTIHEKRDGQNERLSTWETEIISSTSEALEKLLTTVDESAGLSVDRLLTSLKDGVSTIEGTKDHQDESLKSFNEEMLETIESHFTSTVESTSSLLDTNFETLIGNIKAKETEFLATVSATRERATGLLDTAKEDIEALLAETNTIYAKFGANLADNGTQAHISTGENWLAIINEYEESIHQIVTSMEEGLNQIQEETNKKVIETVNEIGSTLQVLLRNNNKAFGDIIEQTETIVLTELVKIIDNLSSDTTKQEASLSKQLSEYLDQFKLQTTEMISSLEENLNSQISGYSEQSNKFSTNIGDSLDSSMEELNSLIIDVKDNLSSFMDNQLILINGLMDQVSGQFTTQITEKQGAMSNELKELINNFEKTLTSKEFTHSYGYKIINHFKELTTKSLAEIKKKSEEYRFTMNESLDDLSTTFQEDTTELREGLNESNFELKDGLPKRVEMRMKDSEMKWSEYSIFYREKVGKLLELLDTLSSEGDQTLQKKLLRGRDEIQAYKDNIDRLAIDLREERDAAEEFFGEAEQVLIESRTGLIDEINRTVVTKVDEIDQQMADHVEDLISYMDDSKGQIEQLGKSYEKLITDGFNETKANYEHPLIELVESIYNDAHKFAKSCEKVFLDVTKNLTAVMNTEFNEQKGTGEELINTSKEKLEETTTQGYSVLSENAENSKVLIQELTKKFNTSIQKETTKLIKQLNTTVQSRSEEHSELVDILSNQIKNDVETTVNGLSDAKEGIKGDMATSLASANEEHKNLSNKLAETVDEAVKEATSKSLGSLGDIRSGFEAAKSDESIFGQEKAFFEEKQTENLEKLKGTISTEINIFKDETDKFLSSSKDKLLKISEDIKSRDTRFGDDTSQDIKDIVEESCNDFEREKTATFKRISEGLVSASSTIKANVNNSFTSVQTSIAEVSGEVTGVINRSDEKLSTETTQHRQVFKDAKEEAETSFNADVKVMAKSFIDENTKTIDDWVSGAKGFDTKFKKESKNHVFSGKKEIVATIDEIPNILASVMKDTSEALKVLEAISGATQGIEPKPIEFTYVEAGKAAVDSIINGTLSDIKSQAVCITPLLSGIEVETMNPKLRPIRWVTDPAQHVAGDNEKLTQLKQKEPPIDFRGSANLDFFLVTRDRECAVFGVNLGQENAVCITTYDEGLVTLMSSVVHSYTSGKRL